MPARKFAAPEDTAHGTLVREERGLSVHSRPKGMWDFVEKNPPSRASLVYTYSETTGNMTVGSANLYARRELLARSKSGQKAGAKPAIPNDVDGAVKVAADHLENYRPKLGKKGAC